MTLRQPPPVDAAVRERFEERWDEIMRLVPRVPKSFALERAERVAQCLDARDFMPEGERWKQLDAVEVGAGRLVLAINALDPALRQQLGVDQAFCRELARIRHESHLHAPTGLKKSGGSRDRRAERVMKEVAAIGSWEILAEFTSEELNTRVRGPFLTLTAILMEIATDRDAGDVYRACRAVLEKIRGG
jgi:hypothetical protein